MGSGTTLEIADWETGSDLRGYCCVPSDPVAAVLVVHGFGEYALRHAKTMQQWAGRRIATYAYDHRGHGTSPGKRAYVERFDALVDDALAVRKRVAAERAGIPLFLFGVSMGGLIATRSAQRSTEAIRGIVLLAPAFAVAENIPPVVQRVLRGVRKIAPALTLAPLSFAKLSRDPAIGEAYKIDPLTYHGGVSLASATELVAAGEAALADAPTFVLPALILQGDADAIVFPIGATRFAEAAKSNRDLTLTNVPGGYHELFNDPGGAALADTAADWMLART
jgi:alpha-beta hydrolase superfamily lysophospholipase